MGEHSSKVEYRRKVLNAEIWANKTKEIMMVAKGDGIKTWTSTYNDGSIDTEYWNKDGFQDKEVRTSPLLTIDDCIDQMAREEANANL